MDENKIKRDWDKIKEKDRLFHLEEDDDVESEVVNKKTSEKADAKEKKKNKEKSVKEKVKIKKIKVDKNINEKVNANKIKIDNQIIDDAKDSRIKNNIRIQDNAKDKEVQNGKLIRENTIKENVKKEQKNIEKNIRVGEDLYERLTENSLGENVGNSVNATRDFQFGSGAKKSGQKNISVNEAEKKVIRKRKKRKRTTVGLIFCLILVFVGTLVTMWTYQQEEKKRFEEKKALKQEEAISESITLLKDYVDCIPKYNYSKMYRMINNATKERRVEENFEFVNNAFYKKIAMIDVSVDVKECIIPDKEVLQQKGILVEDQYDASNTQITYTTKVTTDGGEFSFDKTIDVVKEDDEWHIMWDSSIIYPEYMPMDIVKNSYASALRGEIRDRNGKKLATIKNKARYYPYGASTAHVVGFIARITDEELEEKYENGEVGYSNSSIVGKKGLEYSFESKVKGAGGQTITLCDSNGSVKKKIMESEAKLGDSLKTTIDVNVQKALYDQIKGEKACSVAINPYTGEILGMVSAPSYNNNDVIKGIGADTFNRFSRAFSPGSTFKPITGAVGLDSGAFTKDTNFGPSTKRWQKSKAWGKLFVTTQHQCKVGTLINGITISDNVYFAKAALRIGGTRLKEGLDKLGFNEQIPFEMNFTASQYSNTDGFTSEAMLANSGYGQGQILVNPLHLASIYSAFVNKGDMIHPVFEYSGTPKYWKKDVFKDSTAKTIKECLENVVKSSAGTGYAVRSSKMKVAGKTGTAEIKASQDDENGTELGWFVALTTDTKPEDSILIVTMVEDVEPKGGSAYVVNKTKKMLKAIYGNKY